MLDADLKSPGRTLPHHRAPSANTLGLLDLTNGRPGGSNREEQLGILTEAGPALTPAHVDLTSACPGAPVHAFMVELRITVMGGT
jgi:hypothetical protein